MNDEELKQRIQYLVEHGGLWDDPIADVRKHIRGLYVLVSAALALQAIEAVVLFV